MNKRRVTIAVRDRTVTRMLGGGAKPNETADATHSECGIRIK